MTLCVEGCGSCPWWVQSQQTFSQGEGCDLESSLHAQSTGPEKHEARWRPWALGGGSARVRHGTTRGAELEQDLL